MRKRRVKLLWELTINNLPERWKRRSRSPTMVKKWMMTSERERVNETNPRLLASSAVPYR